MTTMTPAAQPAPLRLQIIRALAVGSLLALIALGLAWELWLAPLRPGGSVWALKVVPLLFPLAGFLRHRLYTFRWVSLLVWLYFAEGVMRAWNDPVAPRWLPLLQIVLCLALFTACALHVRLRLGPRKRKPS
ncbi:DUF2069 domain-containing protein [Ramlibacter tataouinensis]|uniref:DUF2069 domain-containing protein n=1 Tax=Ramlibacter tataouinensis TaxID=94132 RepID=UPI0022F389FA|nr:DUF2069 domain-containing protein [Ramlibacter tataouinensis]WBY01098.1 DUF2069 domain-containing protein [Ramlibacter tataouinensis]